MAGTIQLITASTLTPLIAHCTDAMRTAPLSPLETETIVVQSQGMRRWVTLQLADALGCVGSLALPFPAGFIHDLARRVLPDPPSRDAEDAFSRETMAWRLGALLRDLPADEVHAPLTRYLSDADERKRFGLASRIADRFDDYQLYRADLLAAWEQGDDTPGSTHARWQAALWRRLSADAGVRDAHAGARLRQLVELLHGDAPPHLPTRVTVFGISTLPPLFVAVLAALARHVPVTIYTSALTAPTPHPLAQAFGAQGREFVESMRARGAAHLVLDHDGADASSLLATLQRELVQGNSGTSALTPSRTDSSLRVHSAHGGMRQLEIIRDQLLDALQADSALRPHDLLLLVPDAGTWAPLVDAVFGVNEPGAPRIPYRIADRPARGDDPAAAAFSELLALQGGRFTHSEVFALLAYQLVHEAAGLSEAQVDALATLTHDANVRWGYDAQARASLGLPAYEDATWRASLDRLLLGLMTGRHDDLIVDVLPHSGDTAGDAAGVALLAQWIDRLAAVLGAWQAPRSLEAWVDAMQDAVTLAFGAVEARDADAVASVTHLLDRLRSQGLRAGYAGDVSFGVVRDWIENELEGDGFGSGFLTGGMTIASLKPMRSLPFRIIAVAGLDEGVFPRRDRRAAFDMLDEARRPGDRDLRSDDRQLFLDLLMAAGDRLLLTYSGRAVSDNSQRAASVVIDELLDHVDRRSADTGRAALLVEHPLQPFSPRYFEPDADPRVFTFSMAHARTAVASQQERTGDLPFVTGAVVVPYREAAPTFALTIGELTQCWENTSKYFMRHALGFTIWSDPEGGYDDELLLLDSLRQGGVRTAMLARTLSGMADAQRDLRQLQGSGELPPRALGAVWHTYMQKAVDAAVLKVPTSLPAQVIAVDLGEDDWRLTGTLAGVRGDARFVVRASSFSGKHIVRAWIEHLVLCAVHQASQLSGVSATTPAETILVEVVDGTGKQKGMKIGKVCETFAMVSDSQQRLSQLVASTRVARTMPLAFFPSAVDAWRDAHVSNHKFRTDPKTRIKGLKNPMELARAEYECVPTADRGAPGDHADPHVALCFRGVDPFTDRRDEFERLATALFVLPGSETP